MIDPKPQEQIKEFEKQLKLFHTSGKKTARDYLDLLTLYEKVRHNNVSVSNITNVIETVTKTKIED